jgi:Fic family protein
MKLPEKPPNSDFRIDQNTEKIIEVMRDGEINAKLAEIEKEYPYWEIFKYKVPKGKFEPQLLWLYTKVFLRNKSMSNIKISDYTGFQFKYNTTPQILRLLHEFDLNLGGLFEGRSIIPPDEKNRYLISSIMEESIASSQLEGAATTREIAKEMLRTNRKPTNNDEKMIMNNYLTMTRILEMKDKRITKELILDLHKIISKNTLENSEYEGKFRANNEINVVDGITNEIFYNPPDYKMLDELMDSFCIFVNQNNEKEFIHPIIKAIIIHFLIGYIHPFVDGNGRTARALFYWHLISNGYWLVEYMSISKIIIRAPAKYGRSFLHTEYDENDLTYFIQYNLRCLDAALKNLHKYIQRKVREKQGLFTLITKENINERQAELLRGLLIDNRKSLTIKEVQTKFGIVYQTARTDLMGLEQLGYVQEKKMGKKLIFFRSSKFEEKVKSIESLD